jgi:hypothetical protein
MPKKIQEYGKAHLISVALPAHGDTYTVISHESVIDMSITALVNAGFTIVKEEYRATADGQIAQGIYKLNFNSDPELSMMFAWTNSYNKQVRFKCGIGAYVNKTGTVMVCGDMGSWSRKHTGTADTETQETIDEQVANAHMYYNQLCADKASMESITMNKRKQAQMLGILFAEYQILTTEQASIIRDQMKRPSHVYSDSNSLWAFYNYVTIALQQSHPKTWMEDQRILHMFISEVNKFTPVSAPVQQISTPPQDLSTPVDPLYALPGQTNLLDQIAEVESQLPDNQVVQEEVEIEPVVHQSEEIVLTEDELAHQLYGVDNDIEVSIAAPENEAEEVPFDLDEDDDAVLDSILVPIEKPEPPVTVEEYLEQNILMKDEDGLFEEVSIHPAEQEIKECIDDIVVQYTDPAGNTFEAPIVIDDFAEEDNFDFDLDDIEEDAGDVPDFF